MGTIPNVNVLKVIWDGPHTYDEALTRNTAPVDTGLYQIYGTHGVFGPESILYIGMTLSAIWRPTQTALGMDRMGDEACVGLPGEAGWRGGFV